MPISSLEDILDTEEDIDIPVGPGNMIEPAEFDGMQSTHFDRVPAANYRLRFREDGLEFKDRTGFTGGAVTVSVGDPLTPSVWVDHPGDRSWVAWTLHQGPGGLNSESPRSGCPGRGRRQPQPPRSANQGST